MANRLNSIILRQNTRGMVAITLVAAPEGRRINVKLSVGSLHVLCSCPEVSSELHTAVGVPDI